MTIKSPCINVCRMEPVSGLCEGCLRTLDEIARWSAAGDAEKQAILDHVAERRARAAEPANDPWGATLRCDCD